MYVLLIFLAMGNPPLNLEQAIDALREFPQQLREKNDGKGVAFGLRLWPLEDIIRMFSQSQLKVNKATPQDSIDFSHLSDSIRIA